MFVYRSTELNVLFNIFLKSLIIQKERHLATCIICILSPEICSLFLYMYTENEDNTICQYIKWMWHL
jgi:hypothetical protein